MPGLAASNALRSSGEASGKLLVSFSVNDSAFRS